MTFEQQLQQLRGAGNFRSIPQSQPGGMTDFSSNDYLGLAGRIDLQQEFFSNPTNLNLPLTSSASRLLAARQEQYEQLESLLSSLYGREALLLNSGYHANTGLIPALCDPHTLIVADKLVHASIIDGIRLSGAPFERFRHNDLTHLNRILQKKAQGYERILVIVESVYSMDGDSPDFTRLQTVKEAYPRVMVYVDEAHAMGVLGEKGLGLTYKYPWVDVIIGTFGKALASQGAFAVMSPVLRDIAVNKCRSLIFSTTLPPLQIAWSRFMLEKSLTMDAERTHLRHMASQLQQLVSRESTVPASHIFPFIVGDAQKAVAMSQELLKRGLKVLPIRTPTVPPGTERLRISLSAALDEEHISQLGRALTELCASS